MKSYQIHFIRHGAPAANREGRYVGVTDTPLSQEGIGKLEDMNRRYSYPGAPVFYVSPLKRCVETCKIIYPQVTPILVPALSECNFGEWEGKTAEELKEDPKFQQWLENGQKTAPPGGESGEDFTIRVLNAFDKLVEGMLRTGTTQAVVVTHGGVIMTILSAYGIPKAGFYDWIVGNGCGYSVRITPGLWMRDKVMEVYAKVPKDLDEEQDGDLKYIRNIVREAADRAYGTGETGKKT